MSITRLIIIALLSLSFSLAANKDSPEAIAKKDLDNILQRSFSEKRFLVQISGVFRNHNDKKFLEGETITNTPSREIFAAPPQLPGFEVTADANANAELTPAEYKKEVFYAKEKELLIKLNIQIFYDNTLSAEELAHLKSITQAYLANQLSVKYDLAFTPFAPKTIEPISVEKPSWERYTLGGFLLLLILLIFLWALFRSRKTPTLLAKPVDPSTDYHQNKQGETADSQRDVLRNFLFEQFLGNAEAFRSYFLKLNLEQKSALSELISGPAFEEMLEALFLEPVEKSHGLQSGDQDYSLQFFARDFSEFLRAFHWQRTLFFGFLRQSPLEVLVNFFRESLPLHAAILARFLPAERLSKILSLLSEEKRRAVIKYSAQAAGLSLSKIAEFESEIRNTLSKSPYAGPSITKSDLEFLTDVVSNSGDQDSILADIKAAYPQAFDMLSKLRFNFEDIPSLPLGLVQKVLAELDNLELSLALIGLPADLANYLQGILPSNRRALIISQRASLLGSGEPEIKKARTKLATIFRKELL